MSGLPVGISMSPFSYQLNRCSNPDSPGPET